MLGAEWRYITRSWFSEIQLFPGLGSIARYRYIIQFHVDAYKYILIHPNTSKYIQIRPNVSNCFEIHRNTCKWLSLVVCRYTPGTGHYTLMMWSSVTRMGCGYITYSNQETQPLVAR